MVVRAFLDWFWNPDVWLPPGIDWKDIVPNDKIKYPDPGDLLYPIPFAIGLIFVRYLVEIIILYPWGQYLGLKKVVKKISAPQDNDEILEKAYKNRSSKFTHKDMEALSKRTDMDVRQVERWLRKRGLRDKPSTLTKFSESGWRCICYLASLVMGTYILWDKPYFWDINHCWYDYPHHTVPSDVWWYYAFGSSFYWSLLITQAFDVKRKDFWQMFGHHIVTITLLAFSWFCNLTRIGTIVLLLHDCADAFLEAAKMCKYSKYDKLGDIIFAFFAVIWILTRLGIYPIYILNSTLIEAPKIIPMFPAYYIFNGMLIILLALHVFWTYFIGKVAVKALASGKVQDTRSSSESANDGESEDDDTSKAEHNNKNHDKQS